MILSGCDGMVDIAYSKYVGASRESSNLSTRTKQENNKLTEAYSYRYLGDRQQHVIIHLDKHGNFMYVFEPAKDEITLDSYQLLFSQIKKITDEDGVPDDVDVWHYTPVATFTFGDTTVHDELTEVAMENVWVEYFDHIQDNLRNKGKGN